MRAFERLTALALLALSVAAALSAAPGAGARILVYAALLALELFLVRVGGAAGVLGWIRDLFPVAVVMLVFLSLQPLIVALGAPQRDADLAAADARWLGPLVAAWRGALGRPPWLTDLTYLAYLSFYLLPVSVAVGARARRGGAAFEETAFAILLTFYLSDLGYFLWPASGPRVPVAEEAAVLGGGAVSEAVRRFLRASETTTLDAFPSGHTAVSLVAAAMGARRFPRLVGALAGWASLVVFATVYVSAHYAVDVLAGAVLAGLALVLAGLARPRLSGPTRPARVDPAAE